LIEVHNGLVIEICSKINPEGKLLKFQRETILFENKKKAFISDFPKSKSPLSLAKSCLKLKF